MTLSYQLTDLTMPGASYIGPYNVNDQGTIVGYYRSAGGSGGVIGPVNALQPLKLPSGDIPYAINDNGVVAGAETGVSPQDTFIDDNGVITTFSIPGYFYTYPVAININNEVVGFYGNNAQLGFYTFNNGVLTTLNGIVAKYAEGFGLCVNNGGEIAGSYTDMSGAMQAFTDIGGVISPLNLGLANVSVTGLNDSGVIVGNYNRGSGAFVDDHGVITTLNLPGSVFTQVFGVNNSGLVLGYAASYSSANNQFFLYNIKTNSYSFVTVPGVTPGGGLSIVGFTNSGDVLGQYSSQHGLQAFLATPIDPGPTASNPTARVGLGQSLDLAANALATPGVSGDTLRLTGERATAGSVSVGLNGDLLYTPGASFAHLLANGVATDQVSYTVADQYGNTTTGTLSVTVTNIATTITGGAWGNAVIQGTAGTDIITAHGWNNTIYDNGGNDVVNAGAGNATVYTGAGDVVVNLSGYNNIVKGGDGWVSISGSQGNANISLGNGNESIVATGYNNVIQAGDGNSYVSGIEGNSSVKLGNGTNGVYAAGYNNQISVGNGNAKIVAGDGNDTILTGSGNHEIQLAGWSNVVDAGGSINSININSGGNDLFMLHNGATDAIWSGYSITSGDVFDLASVFKEAGLTIGSDFKRLGTYLHVSNTGGVASLQFDPSGNGNWASGATLAVLHGVGSSIASLSDMVAHNAIRTM